MRSIGSCLYSLQRVLCFGDRLWMSPPPTPSRTEPCFAFDLKAFSHRIRTGHHGNIRPASLARIGSIEIIEESDADAIVSVFESFRDDVHLFLVELHQFLGLEAILSIHEAKLVESLAQSIRFGQSRRVKLEHLHEQRGGDALVLSGEP